MKAVGIDIGYNGVKIICEDQRTRFLSIIGTPDSGFVSSQESQITVTIDGKKYLVGRAADERSRFTSRGGETRDWINTDAYNVLMTAALGWLSSQFMMEGEFTVVTGLPTAYFSDAKKLKKKFLGTHNGQYKEMSFEVNVVNCRVIPQPFGTFFSELYEHDGSINPKNARMASEKTAVLDIGSHTTNIQAILRGNELAKQSTSIQVGSWELVKAVKARLDDMFPDLNISDHQVAQKLSGESMIYHGEDVDLKAIYKPIARDIADTIQSNVNSTMGGTADIYRILVSGGTALLIFEHLDFIQAKMVSDPLFANAIGYANFATRLIK